MMEHAENWVLSIDSGGQARRFSPDALPVSIGAQEADDIHLGDVSGSLQIGMLDGVFFVQPGKDTRSLRIDGVRVSGSRRIADGDVMALDSARLTCALRGQRLSVSVEGVVTGGDTAPPDLDELAREAGEVDEVEIAPIAFRPHRHEGPGAGRAGPSARTLTVAGGFAVLAVLGWFAFTAKSVEIRLEPQPEELSLPGTLLKLHLGDRFLLRSGAHRVVAELEGYYPLNTVIEVGAAPDQSIELALTKLPGRVTLVTQPQGIAAEVTLNGTPLGTTPLSDVEIEPGVHQLRFDAERYLPEVRELEVLGAGERQRLAVALTPNWAPVTLVTEPGGAEVLVDGRPIGSTPIEMELEAGEHRLEARLRGYNAWQDTVVVRADQPQALAPVRLTQADGRVELVSEPSDAAVSVDGQLSGRTPMTLRLAPGRSHMITLTKPGYDPVTRELSVEADSGQRLRFELEPQLGVVEVRSDPAGAQLWVDGARSGVTPNRLTLTAVSHRIEVRQPGFAAQSRDVIPRPGFPQVLELGLQALNAQTGGGYPSVVRTSLGQELKLMTPGRFMMGSSRREPGRRSNEVLRPVELSRAFYLGVREVTNAEFRAFRAEHDSGEFSGHSLDDDDQPVVQITWEDAAQYLNWLSIKDGLQPVYEQSQGNWVPVRPLRNGYRLPTEAEWAWAARFAAQETPLVYPWGAELPPPDRSGNYADIAAGSILPTTLVTYNDGFAVSSPAGRLEPNAVGIHDLGGNVSEWVQDFYEIGVPDSSQRQVDPLGPESGRFHVVRGSSWRSATVTELRLAYRNYSADGKEDLGFRLARNLE